MSELNSIFEYYEFCEVLHQMWFDKTLEYEDNFKEIF